VGEAYRAAVRAAGIAQQYLAEATAAEDAPVRERDPVAAAFDLLIDAPHVQRAVRIGAEGRAALDFEVHRQCILRSTPA
jgi:hypothetical protein